jgi:DHA2 family multidrug resistance protein
MNAVHAKTNPWLIAFVVSLATFMEVLDTTVTNVSLRHISGSLGAGQDESTWILTSYLVANGIILPLSGWLSDTLGRKRFFIGCIIGFTAASFFCGAATSLTSLIIFRIIQGMAGGGLQPTQQAIILDTFPPEKRSTVFAITGITMVFAPILGPTLGGFITDNASWRWIFYINVPVGLFAAFAVWRLLEEEPDHERALKKPRSIDYIGLGLVALGLAAMQIVLDKGQQEDWFGSHFIVFWALVSFVCLSVAIIWLWAKPDPIIDLSLFKDRAFALSCCLIFLTGFVLYGSNALLPLLLQNYYGYNATLAGLILSPGGLAIIIFMPIAAKMIGKFQARYLIVFGLIMSGLGMFYTMGLTPQTDFKTFIGMRISQVMGLPFLFVPISTLAFSNVPRNKSNKASALYSLFRNLGGSIGIALGITHVSRLQQTHQAYLSQHLYPGNIGYDRLIENAQHYFGNTSAAIGHMYQTLITQSAILAYVDAFEFFGVMMLVSAAIAAFLLPANKPNKKPTPDAAAAH